MIAEGNKGLEMNDLKRGCCGLVIVIVVLFGYLVAIVIPHV